MINHVEAIAKIQELTKQKCNEFTLMHYISNAYLDIFIRGDLHICKMSQCGLGDHPDDYFAESVERYGDYLKIEMDLGEVDLNKFYDTLMTDGELFEVCSVKKRHDLLTSYALLKCNVGMYEFELLKNQHNISTHEPIELTAVAAEFELGKLFSRDDFLFDEEQINSIPSFHQAQNKENKFYAPELALAIELWEKMYLEEKGELPSGKTRATYIDQLLDERDIETTKAKDGTSGLKRLKERMKATLNPNPKAKIKS